MDQFLYDQEDMDNPVFFDSQTAFVDGFLRSGSPTSDSSDISLQRQQGKRTFSNMEPSSPDDDKSGSENSDNAMAVVTIDTNQLQYLLKEEEVKKQRLARKAELARQGRRKKKLKISDLEAEITLLQDELEGERKRRIEAEELLNKYASQGSLTAQQSFQKFKSAMKTLEDLNLNAEALTNFMCVLYSEKNTK